MARDASTLVFVEVRTRTSDRFGSPEDSITAAKAQRMARCALEYLAGPANEGGNNHRRGHDLAWRIDLIAIEIEGGAIKRLEHLPDVLQ